MRLLIQFWMGLAAGGLVLLSTASVKGAVQDTLTCNTNRSLVSADIKSAELRPTLVRLARLTGWQILLEPRISHTVSAKFRDLPTGDALRSLLGDLSFALVPGTNAHSRLLVFRTSRENATQLLQADKAKDVATETKVIPNELIVRLKPGVKIDDLARLLGAKVIGRIDGLNAYRLQFDDEASATSAKDQLAGNPDVASVESNFSLEQPEGALLASSTLPPLSLQLKPPPDSGRVIVGLVDTALQPLGNNLDQFLQKAISIAGNANLDPNSPTHGTTMAETILRSVQDATKGSTSIQILPVDVYGPNANTSTFDVAQGIVAAVNGGAKIINLSLGSTADSPILGDLIKSATDQNILLIAAAGNQPVTTPFYPAAYPGVNAVTALDNGQLASYANRGSFVSLAAPGTSFVPFDNLTYGVEGTSVSSAYISGMAAGHMDFTRSTPQQTQSFINSTFGFQPGPSKPGGG